MTHSIIFLGDIVARSGRESLAAHLPSLKTSLAPTLVVANGENASGGLGITGSQFDEIRKAGVDCVTLGDHTYHRKEVRSYLAETTSPAHLIRPANFPPGNPGHGWTCLETSAGAVGVINLMGRTFITPTLDCPFRCFDAIWNEISLLTKTVLVDFHAEATSEKIAFARYVAKRASLVVGTHTHVQTADEQIIDGFTGYISDLGMCGSQQGVIGMQPQIAIQRFMTGMQETYTADENPGTLHGVHVLIDPDSGACTGIKRIRNSVVQP